MATITLERVSKSFGPISAVKDLSITIEDGEFFTLLGPSGCGKTTLLRMVAGLERVSGGRIVVETRDVTALRPKDRDMALVFQDYALYPHLTVRQNLAFPLEARKMRKAEVAQKVQEAAERLQLGELLDRRPKQLSGGQQQRTALGRAMVREPSAFLMDEPLSNLDAKLRIHMRGELKRLQKELGTTTIYVTHDQEEAMTMSDRIAVMRDGEIQQCTDPETLYAAPGSLWVGQFVGSPAMNAMEVEARSEDGGTVLVPVEAEDARFRSERSIGHRRLVMGVRPEHLVVSGGPVEDALKGRVHVVEPVGEYAFVTVRTACGMLMAKTATDERFEMESTVYLTARAERLHLFDATTGERL